MQRRYSHRHFTGHGNRCRNLCRPRSRKSGGGIHRARHASSGALPVRLNTQVLEPSSLSKTEGRFSGCGVSSIGISAPDSFLPGTGYNNHMRSSAIVVFARGSAFLLTLCLLIAPLCSSRCALASCLPSGMPQQPQGSCHHHAPKARSTDSFSSILPGSCQTADSLLLALPAQQFRLLPSLNHGSRALFAVLDSAYAPVSISIDPPRIHPPDSSPRDSLSASRIRSLRI